MFTRNRREFLQTAATVAGGISLIAAPAVVRAGANDRIRVGIVGVGGRGQTHIQSIHELGSENVELAALCDCQEKNLQRSAAAYEKLSGKKATTYADLRKLLDDKSIDAVTFATPNHWHSLGAIWACQANKDAYVEKPGSHNLFEGRKMVEAARKYKRIVQHGTQCRTSPNIREGIAQLKQGVIGRVYMARAVIYKIKNSLGRHKTEPTPPGLDWDLWLGPAPQQPFSQVRLHGWHYLWDFGNGQLGNQGVHQLDIIRWGLGIDTLPTQVQAMGGHLVHEDDQETPDTLSVAYRFGDRKLLAVVEVRNWYTNEEAGMGDKYPFVDHQNVVGVIFLGSEGYMILPDYSSYRTFLGKSRRPGPSKVVEGNPMMDTDHFRNWIAAVRSRKPEDLNAEILQGHLSSAMNHMANIAYRTQRTLQFDPNTERFASDDEANRMLTRAYRAPYLVPSNV
jgi:predicted dehydrogenase